MRLLTRSDFDGLACAVLLVRQGIVDEYEFVHPNIVQHGDVEVTSNDVLANIPYADGCGLWFDHHASENERLVIEGLKFEGSCKPAPSAAQVIWDYYSFEESSGKHLKPLLDAVNKSDLGNVTNDEILNPQGWDLLSFIMDPRTGLGRFKDYKISNYQLMEDMIEYCQTKTVEEILQVSDVTERTNRYFEHQKVFSDMLRRTCKIDGNVIVTNLLNEEVIYCGNRFLVYALYPEQNIEVRLIWGKEKQSVFLNCGHSILNRTSKTNVGDLMLKFDGGGHDKVGSCQIKTDEWEQAFEKVVNSIKEV